ncbi:MAG: glycoside hydrolase family 3 C-terminal domain-containing protein [Bacteroidales bacterium]|nr:glycoside hydrolase family 3 C-terminal domain-containing protein [Bacteroidales bacterium]
MKVFRALPVYKDISYSSAERTNDLLLRMTLDEKIGQLLCPTGWEMYEKKGDEVYCSEKYKQAVKKQNIGMLWAVFRADPWTKKTLKTGLDPKLAAETANKLQKYAIENSRLGIPVFIAEECPHGHMAIGTTVFPTGIALASSWSDSLLRAVGAVISREVRSQGAHIAFGPVIDLAREPRWSRVEETYGEDPCLSGRMAAAMVNGEGGGRLSGPYDAISTLKHFIAYGVPSGGQNGNASVVGLRELMQDYIPPFKMALDAGALSVMTAYSSIDGLPCTANKYLLDDVLRGQLKFRGMVISDLFSIEGLKDDHNVCPSYEDAAAAAMTAGVDVDLGVTAYEKLKKALALHLVEEKDIDSAAARVLRLKFAMGLFDYPYVDPKKTAGNVDSPANRKVALQAARESVVLLKNLRNILPLNKDVENVLVVGPNADNVYNMLGDYTAPQDPGRIVTVYDGIRKKLGEKHVMYVKGCSVRDTVNYNIDEAVRAASKADVVIAVVGGSSARDFKTEYKETGAAVSDAFSVSDMECGEGYDRATLCLLGRQMELLKKLKVAGKPLVVVYIEGRPLRMNWASENADALLTAWYPGEEGGSGIADVLFGDYNPSGRLPVSVPRSVGQLPVYYDQKMPLRHNYVEEDSSPLYPFGYGLSYTDFKYSGLKINSTSADSVVVSFCIRNIGKCTGWSVPQLYLRDECASVSQPVKELKGFEKVFLRKGEAKTVSFVLKPSDFSLININMKRVTEPGSFNIMIGESSSDIVLSGKLKR